VAKFSRASTHKVWAKSTAAFSNGALLAIHRRGEQFVIDSATSKELQEITIRVAPDPALSVSILCVTLNKLLLNASIGNDFTQTPKSTGCSLYDLWSS
jgi:hypothetical protein